jgi:hypothetical protein
MGSSNSRGKKSGNLTVGLRFPQTTLSSGNSYSLLSFRRRQPAGTLQIPDRKLQLPHNRAPEYDLLGMNPA